jgi:hypothetical protein
LAFGAISAEKGFQESDSRWQFDTTMRGRRSKEGKERRSLFFELTYFPPHNQTAWGQLLPITRASLPQRRYP